ncbi:MAG: hypothetical protein GY861_12440 [bacterium]|nr:hypothetical protein [bacterium]
MERKEMFYNYDYKRLPIENLYKGQTCFLVLSGPSLNKIDLEKLKQPGIVTFGVNNSPKTFRPNLWTSGDGVQNFMISIYQDPTIMKFISYGKRNNHLFDNSEWKESDIKVSDCPNVVHHHLNTKFSPETYLKSKSVSWGRSRGDGGCRSVMLAAVRIIYSLGFKKVFIIGADFKMEEGNKYAFEQDRTAGSMRNNNNAYKKLNERFDLLRPIFEKAGFYVFNSTPDSGLKSFDYVPYESAVKIALKGFPDTVNEPSEGMYDREAKLREEERLKTHGIIYYNTKKAYLVRLAVSISSLRRVYSGSVTILCDQESEVECNKIGEKFDVQVKVVDFSTISRNTMLFNKTLLHKFTPYETNIFLDADTLIIKGTVAKLFKFADEHDFVTTQFSDWTPKTRIVGKRISQWKDITEVKEALEYPYAVNTGVFAFKTDSNLVKDWYDLASKGEKFFIPDEVSCQVMLPNYKHHTVGASFNTSCKFGNIHARTAVIHYHGNKHCRINGSYQYNSKLWYDEFDEIKDFVKDNIKHDRQLRKHIGFHDSNCVNA